MRGKNLGKCLLLALLAALLLTGCSALNAIKASRDNLEESVKEYQRMIRWQEANGAYAYVAESLRPLYLERAVVFDTVKIVDYRIRRVDTAPDRKKATVEVEYQYHPKNGVIVKSVIDTQQWEFFETTDPAGWRITSLPPAFP